MPKVSVIIPTFNRAELLRSAIKSAINQTFQDIEIIVSDDGSTDHTKEVVESYKDKRIKYIQNKGNKGVASARNKAILKSEGEYIAFLDSDDEWLPDKLQKQVKVLDNCKHVVCGVHSEFLIIDKITNKIIPFDFGRQKYKGNLLNQLSIGDPIKTSSVLLRKKCLDKVGLFDESFSYFEDRDLWIRLSIHYDFEYISEPLIKYYIHENAQLTQNLIFHTAGREKLLERYQHLFKTNKRYYSKLHVHLGVQYCQLKKMRAGRNNIIKGIKIYPFKIKTYFHLFSSFLGPNNYKRLRNFYKSIQIKL